MLFNCLFMMLLLCIICKKRMKTSVIFISLFDNNKLFLLRLIKMVGIQRRLSLNLASSRMPSFVKFKVSDETERLRQRTSCHYREYLRFSGQENNLGKIFGQTLATWLTLTRRMGTRCRITGSGVGMTDRPGPSAHLCF